MTAFSKDKTFVGFLGESNSVKYKLNVAAISKYSILKGYIYINDVEITRNFADGINVFKITNNTLVEQKTFAVTSVSATNAANAFVSYMSSLQTDSYYIIVTGKNFVYTDIVYNFMIQQGSTCFPIQAISNDRYASAYVGLYNSSKKSIVNENTLASDKTTLDRAKLEVVYDDISDQGATGFPKRAVYDPTDYSTATSYEYIKYPKDQVTAALSDYRLSPGDTVSFSGELYASAALLQNGMTSRASLRLYQGNTLLTVLNIDAPSNYSDLYYKFEKQIDIPANADQFAISVQRYPQNDNVNAVSKCRNLTLVEVSTNSNKNKIAMFGVNGLKASNFVEYGSVSPVITTMYDNVDMNNLNTNGIVEEDFYLPDYVIRTNVGTGHIPYESEVDRAGPGYYMNRDNQVTYAEYNEARIDWVDNKAKGILVEKDSTNLFVYSNDFSKMSSYATKNGKFGSLDLWNLKSSGNINVGLEGLRQTTITESKYYIQFIVRKNTGGKIMFGTKIIDVSGNTFYTRFTGDIGNGSLSPVGNSPLTYTVQNLGNDYWYYRVVYSPTSTAKSVTPILSCGSGNTSDSIDLAYIQMEGSLPTSFILTQDQPVTRVKDIPMFNIPVLNYAFSVLYIYINQDNPDVVVTEIVDYSNTVPPFVSSNFKSGWVVETSVFNRVLTDQEKNNIRGG